MRRRHRHRETPASRDALLTRAVRTRTRNSRVSTSSPAYTYADPKHWSRAVSRLAVDAQGAWAAASSGNSAPGSTSTRSIKSNFYLQDVKENQRVTAIWREYLDFDAGGWDFRVGAQNIVWE
jgi:hypothetical protein